MFTDKVTKMVALLNNRPTLSRGPLLSASALKESTRAKATLVETLRQAIPGFSESTIGTTTAKDMTAQDMTSLSNHKKLVAAALRDLSPTERRKLAALAVASKTGVSVAAAFRTLRTGATSAALARGEDLQKGLDLAKAQKVNLEAATW
jgi:hypothetical protein